MLGMPLDQVIARATVNAARVFDAFNDRGTLNVGAPADVAILELREGTFDSSTTMRQADRQAAAVPERDRDRRQAGSAQIAAPRDRKLSLETCGRLYPGEAPVQSSHGRQG